MRNLLIFSVFLFVSTLLYGQTGTIVISRPNGPLTEGDSVSAGTCICMDTTVVSFLVSFSKDGILTERKCSGNCYTVPKGTKSGTKVWVTQIVAEPAPGVRIRKQERQFIVR